MQKIIRYYSFTIYFYSWNILQLSLNRSSNYSTENLVGNKLAKIKLKSFENNKFLYK